MDVVEIKTIENKVKISLAGATMHYKFKCDMVDTELKREPRSEIGKLRVSVLLMEVSALLCGGTSHSIIVDENQTVFCSGWNGRGQFGTNSTSTEFRSLTLTLPFGVQSVVAGQSHSHFLDVEGNVWSCGWNSFGQLGFGIDVENQNLKKIETLPRIVKIATKYNHSLALDESGGVWVFGWNSSSQLGVKSKVNLHSPTKLESLPRIQDIAAGREFSIFLDEDGNVWGCGLNSDGQLGTHVDQPSTTEVKVPVIIPNLPIIRQISAGLNHCAFLDNDSVVWLVYKQITSLTTLPPIKFVASNSKSYYLDFDGDVWQGSPQQQPTKIPDLPAIVSIGTGLEFAHFVDIEGCVWSSGNNSSKQLNSSEENRNFDRPFKQSDIKMRIGKRTATKSARKL